METNSRLIWFFKKISTYFSVTKAAVSAKRHSYIQGSQNCNYMEEIGNLQLPLNASICKLYGSMPGRQHDPIWTHFDF